MTTPKTPRPSAATQVSVRDLLVATYSEVGAPDDDERPTYFREAHDYGSPQMYAVAIIDRAEQRGVLWAAFDDIAGMGLNFDHEDAVDGLYWALDALPAQWSRVADLLLQGIEAMQVRVACGRLRKKLASHMNRWWADKDSLDDLLTIAELEAAKVEHSIGYAMAEEAGQGKAWLIAHAATVREQMDRLNWLHDDLVDRGELHATGAIVDPHPDVEVLVDLATGEVIMEMDDDEGEL